ncbi:cytidine deaminase [[Haemophilus] felis]|nr:cytidine deaminase [[Haemophilus] felis]
MALSISRKIKDQLHLVEPITLAEDIFQVLQNQDFKGYVSHIEVEKLTQKYHITAQTLALKLLPIAASYSHAPISQFYVGAIVIGTSGDFYFGTNVEFIGTNIQQTIHAEQSAISHAWMNNEQGISDVIVNYTPCGHCRQFMNELNCASELRVHLPHSQNNQLSQYLPDAFGPKDLAVTHLLLDEHHNQITYSTGDKLAQIALDVANMAHSPYSQSFIGVGLQTTSGKIFKGSYAENAAFNPSLPALQVALNCLLLSGGEFSDIERVVVLERAKNLSYRKMTMDLLDNLSIENVEYICL